MTLRARLTLAFVAVVLFPLLVGAALVARAVPAAVEGRQGQGLVSMSRLATTLVSGYCDQERAAAEAAGRAAAGAPPAQALEAARSLVARGLADGIRVTDAHGRLVAEAGQLPAAPRDCALPSRDGSLTAVLPLATATVKQAGTAYASIKVDGGVAARIAAGAGADVALLAGGAVVGSSQPVSPALVRLAAAHPYAAVREGRLLAVLAPASAGRPVGILLVAPVAASPGILGVAIAVVLFSVAVAALLGLTLARATTRPLAELGAAASRIAAGDLSGSIEVRSKDEVGRLAGAFNVMTAELRTYIGELQASRDELQAGLARLGDTLSGTHDLDRILGVVLETAMAATRAQAGMVLLVSDDGGHLELVAGRGVADRGVPDRLTLPLGQGFSGRAAKTVVTSSGRIGTRRDELRPAFGEPAKGSVITVPFTSSGRVIGVLDLFDKLDDEDFDAADLKTIRNLASQAAVAVDNVRLHQEARRLSVTDALTGLGNFLSFTSTVAKEVERAARFARPMALLMLDLDHFKAVNDTHGHQRGDAVLIEVAARVLGQVRDVDTVARYGGEEIVVVLPETDLSGAELAAERICSAMRAKPIGKRGQVPVSVTVSIGVAVFPQHGTSAEGLLRSADTALYAAKHAGRDTWRAARAERRQSKRPH